MSLDLRKIEYFTALYEEGSMKRAAERHNIVQPAMSMQLKQLEAELSVQLFDRSAQGVHPTPAGRHFYKLCVGLLRDLRTTRQEMLDFGDRVKGQIRLGLMPSICRGPHCGENSTAKSRPARSAPAGSSRSMVSAGRCPSSNPPAGRRWCRASR